MKYDQRSIKESVKGIMYLKRSRNVIKYGIKQGDIFLTCCFVYILKYYLNNYD